MVSIKNSCWLVVLLQFAAIHLVSAQSYSFKPAKLTETFDIRSDEGGVSCLFRTSDKKAQPTVFRKVSLDRGLRPIDSIEYTIPGIATLVANNANGLYTTHVFYSKNQKIELFYFLVTDQSGKIHSTFTKSAADFDGFFPNPIRPLRRLGIDFIDNTTPEMIIFRPRLADGYGTRSIKTGAFSIEDGARLWTIDGTPTEQTITTENEFIGLADLNETKYRSNSPAFMLQFYSKKDGRKISEQHFYNGPGRREISIMTSNGQELMIAGTHYGDRSGKNGHFFMSLYDLQGARIFDKVDTTEGLSPKRMHMLGSAFDQDGNLFIICEGWKNDYTGVAVTAAASILTALLVGGVPVVGSAQPNQKITSLVMAKISTENGGMKKLYTFPVGPWLQFSRLITDGSHVLIRNSSKLLMYDPDKPEKFPTTYAILDPTTQLLLAPFGPVAVKKARKTINLRTLDSQPDIINR